MSDVTYRRFVERWQEVTQVPPQQLGPLTPAYKKLAGVAKAMPWPVLVFSALLIVIGLYLLLGRGIAGLVSLLQRGF